MSFANASHVLQLPEASGNICKPWCKLLTQQNPQSIVWEVHLHSNSYGIFVFSLAMPQTKVWWKGMDNQWPGKKIPGAEENRLVALNMSCAFDSLYNLLRSIKYGLTFASGMHFTRPLAWQKITLITQRWSICWPSCSRWKCPSWRWPAHPSPAESKCMSRVK